MTFANHFAAVAGHYASARPTYPDALFAWLASQSPAHELAWDCACGSGQATLDLASYFDLVIGTDASAEQLVGAQQQPNIEYRQAPAEESGLADGSVDLITAAQAYHWFDAGRFAAEARRVLRPGGVLAVWSYGLMFVDSEEVGGLIYELYEPVLGPYWPAERRLVESGYANIDLGLDPVEAPAFEMVAEWPLERLLGYLSSWSAAGRYRAATGRDAVAEMAERFASAWGDPATLREIRWPLALRVGRKG